MNHDVLSIRKPEASSCVLYQDTASFTSTYGAFTQRLWGQDVGQTVARLDPWPARFLHTSRVGALQRQAVIEKFSRDRALTSINAMMGLHLALCINLWFSQTGLLLSHLSFALCLLISFFSFETNAYSTDTRNNCTLLPKKSPNASNYDRSWLFTRSCCSVRVNFLFSARLIVHFNTYTVRRKWEHIINRGFEKSQSRPDVVLRTPSNSITNPASTVVASLTGAAALAGISEGMHRFLAAGLSITYPNSTPSSPSPLSASLLPLSTEFATIAGTKRTTIWRANDAKMPDSREGEEDFFFSLDACYCCQCDDAAFVVLKLNSCVVFRRQGVGR